jgi:hypothetical protein
MGGSGSGTWTRTNRKTVVEVGLVLSMRMLRANLIHHTIGSLCWHRGLALYVVNLEAHPPHFTLWNSWGPIADASLRVPLTRTRMRWGHRWWFRCPLLRNGIPCHRRVGKLYVPPDGHHFGCRQCHNLTYLSTRHAHQAERTLAHLGFDAETIKAARRAFRDLPV